MKLAASLLLLAMVVSGQEHHSVQKRQTTVNKEKVDVEAIVDPARTDTNLVEAGLLAIFLVILVLGASSGFQLFLSSSVPSIGFRSLQSDYQFPNFLSRLYSSIDLVDTAFNYMDIEDETCRLKTICEVESYAINHPLAKLAINTINKSLSGLERYQDAIDAGMNGQDCALIYDQCPFSYFGY